MTERRVSNTARAAEQRTKGAYFMAACNSRCSGEGSSSRTLWSICDALVGNAARLSSSAE